MGTCRDGAPGCCLPALLRGEDDQGQLRGRCRAVAEVGLGRGEEESAQGGEPDSLPALVRPQRIGAQHGEDGDAAARVYRGKLAKEANIRNPREFQAADAMPRAVLLQLVEGARALKHLMPIERTALDALVVAFSTVSGGRSWRCVWRTCRRTGGR